MFLNKNISCHGTFKKSVHFVKSPIHASNTNILSLFHIALITLNKLKFFFYSKQHKDSSFKLKNGKIYEFILKNLTLTFWHKLQVCTCVVSPVFPVCCVQNVQWWSPQCCYSCVGSLQGESSGHHFHTDPAILDHNISHSETVLRYFTDPPNQILLSSLIYKAVHKIFLYVTTMVLLNPV